MTPLTSMKNFKSLLFVIHSQLMKEKISPCPVFELGSVVWQARILTTEPPDLHSIQASESYLNIITEISYTIKLICLCYSWFYSQPSMTVIFLFLFISHGLKFMRKEISFYVQVWWVSG